MKIRMIIELDYDAELMHGDDQDAIDWFNNEILIGKKGLLMLQSNEIGDNVGKVEVVEILTDKVS